jgi:hypothetical protein
MNLLQKKLIKPIETRIKERKYQKVLPTNPLGEDIYLVSFPKSGNTWLRFLVANAIKLKYNIEREVNFFSIQEVIPDIHLSKNIRSQGVFGRTDLPRIIKSHTSYNPYYHRVILLVRDPRDAIVSYYYYTKERNSISPDWTISQFIRSDKYGIKAWLKHTQSWYLTLKQGQNIQIINYEKLVANPQQQIANIMDLLGITMEEHILEKAIILSSKSKMKESENKHRSTYIIQNNSRQFVRDKKAQRGKDLSEVDREYIENMTRDIAQKLGYDY